MPDLSIITQYACETAFEWRTRVTGSKGDIHIVEWGRTRHGNCLYGWSCSCKGFQYHHTCKHVREVEASGKRCGWSQEAHGGSPINGHCPKCGCKVRGYLVGV